MPERWRVAVLDSGLSDPKAAPVASRAAVAACRFIDTGEEVVAAPAIRDPIGHGTAVAGVICSELTGSSDERAVVRHSPTSMELLVAQVLDHRGVATAAGLAAAIRWSLGEGANLIHMSLGLRGDRRVLAEAVGLALEGGCVVVASAPARGEVTFPARYPQVIRATGDARCQTGEISALESAQADFGGCPRYGVEGGWGSDRFGGASLGAAHVTRFLVGRISPGDGVTAVRAQLREMARYRGVEMRAGGV